MYYSRMTLSSKTKINPQSQINNSIVTIQTTINFTQFTSLFSPHFHFHSTSLTPPAICFAKSLPFLIASINNQLKQH